MLILSKRRVTRIYRLFFCFILWFFGGLTAAVAGEMHFQGDGIRIDLRSDDDKVFQGQLQIDGQNYATTATLENASKLVGSYKKGLVTTSYIVSEDNGKLLLRINNQEYALHDSSGGATPPQPQTPPQQSQPAQQTPPQQTPPATSQQTPPAAASIPAGWSTAKTQYGYTVAYPSSWQKAEQAELMLLLPSNNRNNEMVILTNYPVPGFSQSTTEQQLAQLRTEISSEMNIGAMQLQGQPQTLDAAVGSSTKVEYLFRNSAGEGLVRIIYTVDEQDNVLILFNVVNKAGANLNKDSVHQIWQLLRRNNHAAQGQTSTNQGRDPNVVGVWCGENVHSSSVSNSYSSSSFCYTFNADGTYADKSTTLIDVDGSGGGRNNSRVNGNANSIGNNNVTGHWTTRGDTLYLNSNQGAREITYSYFVHSGNGIPHLRWGTEKPYTYLEKQR